MYFNVLIKKKVAGRAGVNLDCVLKHRSYNYNVYMKITLQLSELFCLNI